MSEQASKHTPGPWRIGDAGRTVFGPPNGNPSPQTVASVTHKANARLIAAAPEMLEALRGMLATVERGEADSRGRAMWTIREGATRAYCDALDAARSTIAKATGGSDAL